MLFVCTRRGVWKTAFCLIPHPSQQLFLEIIITHKRKKRKKSRSRLYNVSECIADSLEPPVTAKSGTPRELLALMCAEEF